MKKKEVIRKKREASALHSYFWEAGGGGVGRMWSSETTASKLFSLEISDNNSQQDEGIAQGPDPVSFWVYKENSCWYLWPDLGIPTSYQEAAREGIGSVQGSVAAGGCCFKGEAVSAVSELHRQKAVTRIMLHVNRLCVCWQRCALLRTWPWGHEHFRGPPGNNMHGLSATFMLQTYRT